MLAYLAFGLQNLAANDRAAITTAVFNWFESASSVLDAGAGSLSLEPNYPNPFSGSTELSYTTATDGPVRVSIVDARGTEVAVPLDKFQQAGLHSATLDFKALAAGTYFAVVRTPNASMMRAMTKE